MSTHQLQTNKGRIRAHPSLVKRIDQQAIFLQGNKIESNTQCLARVVWETEIRQSSKRERIDLTKSTATAKRATAGERVTGNYTATTIETWIRSAVINYNFTVSSSMFWTAFAFIPSNGIFTDAVVLARGCYAFIYITLAKIACESTQALTMPYGVLLTAGATI